VRFIISGLLILPFTVKPAIYIKMIKEHWRLVVMVTLLQTVVNYTLFYKGMNMVPGALGAVIVGSQPLVTTLVAAVIQKDDRLTKQKMFTIILGLAGVILISAGRQAFDFGTGIEILGVVLIFVANISTSLSNVLVSMKSKGMNPLVLSSASLFMGGGFIFLLSLPVEGIQHNQFPSEYWIALLWLSFMAAAAFSIWYKLLQRPGVKVSELNMWKFIIPVAGAILSWILVPGENPEWITVAGMFIITISLILLYRNTKDNIQEWNIE